MIKAPADRVLRLKELAQAPRHGRVFIAEMNQLDCYLSTSIRVARQGDDSSRALTQGANYFVLAYFLCHASTGRYQGSRTRDSRIPSRALSAGVHETGMPKILIL